MVLHACVVVGCAIGFLDSLHSLLGEIQLSKRGIVTTGILTSSRQEFSDEIFHHYASYRFSLAKPHDNTVLRKEVRVNKNVYQVLQQGSSVDVRYLPCALLSVPFIIS